MKNLLFVIISLLALGACNNQSTSKDDSGSDKNSAVAEISEKGTFQPFDIDKDWDENPFTWFKGQGLLLAVGDSVKNNAMTIGWGSLGNLWKEIGANTVTVYVAEERYTYQFMEENRYFTVMAFDKDDARILGYMGTHSGRDGDKAAHLGLHTLYTEHGTPYYEEASIVLECEIIYKAPFLKEGMCEDAQKFYEGFSAGVHHMYIGNVINAMKKE